MNAQSKYGGLSMRNIMIRKKLAERKRFDSADYAMQSSGIKNDDVEAILPAEEQKKGLQIYTKPPALQTPRFPNEKSVQSPVQIGMAAFFDSMEDPATSDTAPNSPSIENMTLSPANRQTNVSSQAQSKYGALSARNLILRRKLAQRTKFDSADYQLQKYGHGDAADVQIPASMEALVVDAQEDEALPVPPIVAAPVTAPPPPATAQPNYGKLCAQNILFRKKLKERKRFDSADYSMENSASKGNIQTTTPSAVVSAAPPAPLSSSSDQHQPKHIKLSIDSPTPSKEPRDLFSPTSRVAARNIFLQRKLQERKRFDSADYFQEKQRHEHDH
ncbi:unnamed protein product [Aphanomyces euteiches]|uniref:Uncharacterized protein n=1 Tax=Aphanomyces euteiches TaxID=100861 RepID=A0A6G0X0E3_9STRA|nr:hypothetical protein Ae201684_009600 [Aphanomyces euteiches]KAH9085705.1 hypothetical protein Ae201684P_005408 [Aphanomyces euteiches]KAH9157844.1 hypothetical protein AeRB84_000316 [Aphanomyces euteiches]